MGCKLPWLMSNLVSAMTRLRDPIGILLMLTSKLLSKSHRPRWLGRCKSLSAKVTRITVYLSNIRAGRQVDSGPREVGFEPVSV